MEKRIKQEIHKELFGNSIIYLLGDMIVKFSYFLLLPYITRNVTPETFSNITIVTVVSVIVAVIVSLCAQTAITRFYYVYKNIKSRKLLLSSILNMYFISCIIVISFLTLFSLLQNEILGIPVFPYFLIMISAELLLQYYVIVASYFRIQQKALLITKISTISGLFGIGIRFFCIVVFQDKFFGWCFGYFIAYLIQFITVSYLIRNEYFFYMSFKKLCKYYSYSIRTLPITISANIVSLVDRIMIVSIAGSYMNGIYSAGYKLGEIVNYIFIALNSAYIPFCYKRYTSRSEQSTRELRKGALFYFLMYSIIAVIFLYFINYFNFILGKNYSSSINVTNVIIFSMMFNGWRLVFNNPLDFNKQYLTIKNVIWIFSSIQNIVCNYYFINKYGIIGAAYSTAISFIFSFIAMTIFSVKSININYHFKEMFGIAIGSCVGFLTFGLSNLIRIPFLLLFLVYIAFIIKKEKLYEMIYIRR